MLRIQRNQLEAFVTVESSRFEADATAHVREYFPNHHRIFGDHKIRQLSRHAITRAARHGFVTRRDVLQFLNVMLMLGGNFDEDLQLPWASDLLRKPRARSTDRLSSLALDHFDSIAGPRNTCLLEALRDTRRELDRLRSTIDVSREPEDVLLGRLRALYPRKYERAGAGPMGEVVRHAMTAATRYGLVGGRSVYLYALLAFWLGTRFDDGDPLTEWATSVLRDPSIPSESERAGQLLEAADHLAERWLSRA
jgi:hypothetical protein